jgi:hypothetical protein
MNDGGGGSTSCDSKPVPSRGMGVLCYQERASDVGDISTGDDGKPVPVSQCQ